MHKDTFTHSLNSYLILLASFLLLAVTFNGCANKPEGKEPEFQSKLNLSHLDYLGEVVTKNDQDIRLIHIYADAPTYEWVGDDDEGIACVDDVARAAVVYLRHFELTGSEDSYEKAKQLLRFILYMQTEEGLFHNFVFSNSLDKNTTHKNSVADKMNWWGGRAVWALGMGGKVLAEHDASFSQMCLTSIDKTLPHIQALLDSYPTTKTVSGYEMPTWLVSGSASDATSELLMGLAAANEASPKESYQDVIQKLSEGIAMMQYGSIKEAPFGAHLSYEGGWHGWGNSQTMALSEAGYTESAIRESSQFYPWMLVNGWMHSFSLDNPNDPRLFEQIAYATRGVAVGLIRVYEQTNEEKYAVLAGLAASWFTGNNVAEQKMYNPLHGYGYDGINSPSDVNMNSGAESTIEALMTILEVEQHPIANKWMYANSSEPQEIQKEGKVYTYKVYEVDVHGNTEQVAVVLNQTDGKFKLMDGNELNEFLNN